MTSDDRPADASPAAPPDRRNTIGRYTITSEGASLGYFRLVEDPAGAWCQFAEVTAALAGRPAVPPHDLPTFRFEFTADDCRVLLEALGLHRERFTNGYRSTLLADKFEAALAAPAVPSSATPETNEKNNDDDLR